MKSKVGQNVLMRPLCLLGGKIADFHQNGVVSTLHNISNRSVKDLEKELMVFSKKGPLI